MKHLDLFSGIGGFALAARGLGIKTCQFVEIDPYCQKVLAKNFPGIPIHGDISTFTAEPGQFDLITFGSPCQDLSSANSNGRGLEGERSGLFYEAIRIIRMVQPRFTVFENVPNLLVKDGGIHFQRVLWAFYESGFDAEWQVISAASVGAPHLRERVFIVAYNQSIRRRTRIRGKEISTREDIAFKRGSTNAANTQSQFTQAPIQNADAAQQMGLRNSSWWTTEPGVLRVVHGVSNRVDRIRGCGNAVIPQVAAIALQRVLELAQN